jgi:ribosomal protein S18 acetylase RimI-like enzyme
MNPKDELVNTRQIRFERDGRTQRIRTATPDDAFQIAKIHIASWQAAYRGQLPDKYLDSLSADLSRRTAFWARWLAGEGSSRGQTVLVAQAEECAMAGFASFGPSEDEPPDPNVGQVYAIYLNPNYWDTGIGRALFTAATKGLRDARFSEAILWVLHSNERARLFYENAGWKADGATKGERRGEVVLTEVRYRVRLGDSA